MVCRYSTINHTRSNTFNIRRCKSIVITTIYRHFERSRSFESQFENDLATESKNSKWPQTFRLPQFIPNSTNNDLVLARKIARNRYSTSHVSPHFHLLIPFLSSFPIYLDPVQLLQLVIFPTFSKFLPIFPTFSNFPNIFSLSSKFSNIFQISSNFSKLFQFSTNFSNIFQLSYNFHYIFPFSSKFSKIFQ